MSAAKELGGLAKRHEYLLGQMVPAMQMVRASRFRYSAPLVPWTDAEMEDLHSVWLRVHKAAWWLTPSYAAAPFRLPSGAQSCNCGFYWCRRFQNILNNWKLSLMTCGRT